MRKMVFGYYRNKVYVIEDEDGKVLYNLSDGAMFDVDRVDFYVGENERGMFVAKIGVLPTSKGIFYLEDQKKYLMATTQVTARNQLFKEYKPLKRGDILFDTLKKYKFIPQCMKTKDELTEVEIPASYRSWCHNYSPEKKWYKYKLYSDCTDWSEVRACNQACQTCPNNANCPDKMKRSYRGLYNGTYYFLVKENVRTGEKSIQEIEVTEEVDRAALVKIIDEAMVPSNVYSSNNDA